MNSYINDYMGFVCRSLSILHKSSQPSFARLKLLSLFFLFSLSYFNVYSQCTHSGGTTVIISNTTWNTPMTILGDVVVTSGFTLTITSNIYFMPGAELIVKANAQLIVNGGDLELSPACSTMWKGIIVEGDNTQTQALVGGIRAQGYVEIINNGIIQGAEIGVSLWDRVASSSSGGVLIADGAHFIDNHIGIHFNTYPASGSGITASNLSKIDLSIFYNSPVFVPLPTDPKCIVAISVRGLSIRGCHFESATYAGYFGGGLRAIQSLSSSINVVPYCATLLCPTPVPNTFHNLYWGVLAWFNGSHSVNINDNEFEDCYKSIDLWELDNPLALGNEIDMRFINTADTISPNISTGIGTELSDGYRIEENIINAGGRSKREIGINITDSGPEENQVYKNTINYFEEQHYYQLIGATRAYGNNAASIPIIEGLQWVCNIYNDNQLDLVAGPLAGSGMRWYQGEPSTRTSPENQFIHTVTYGMDIFNEGGNSPIEYLHTGGTSDPTITWQVNKTSTINGHDCKSKRGYEVIDPDPERRSQSQIDSLYDSYINLIPMLIQTKSEIFSAIDNGNTPGLSQEVLDCTTTEMATAMYVILDELSPYVSRQVCKKVIENENFSEAQVMDILISNPDATRLESFITFLSENASFPVTNVHIENIRSSWGVETELTVQLFQSATLSSNASEAGILLLTFYKSKEETDNERILEIYDLWPSMRYKYAYVDNLLETASFGESRTYLNSLDERFNLNCQEISEINNYLSWVDFLEYLHLNEKGFTDLSVQDLQVLTAIAETCSGRASGKAEQILCMIYNNCDLNDPATCTEENNGIEEEYFANSVVKLEEKDNLMVNVFPNPVSSNLNILLNTANPDNTYSVNLFNIQGKVVISHLIQGGENRLSIESLTPGIYSMEVLESGVVIHRQKLIVLKN